MARGARKTVSEQIEMIDEQIEKLRQKMDILLQNKESLLQKKKEKEIDSLYQLIQNKGLSVSDVEKIVGEN